MGVRKRQGFGVMVLVVQDTRHTCGDCAPGSSRQDNGRGILPDEIQQNFYTTISGLQLEADSIAREIYSAIDSRLGRLG